MGCPADKLSDRIAHAQLICRWQSLFSRALPTGALLSLDKEKSQAEKAPISQVLTRAVSSAVAVRSNCFPRTGENEHLGRQKLSAGMLATLSV